MIITKIFTAESSHKVSLCSSKRCALSYHGHSYKIEVSLECNKLDNGGMVLDFGLMKGAIKSFIDSMDHTHIIWNQDHQEARDFFKKHNDRWIEVPFNPSAEWLAIWIAGAVQDIILSTKFANNEGNIKVHSVTVWETATGRARATLEDVNNNWKWSGNEVIFSDGVIEEWHEDLKKIVIDNDIITNPEPFKEIR